MVLNSIKLKELNVELVKLSLKSCKFATKNSIAADTGLSVASCRNILADLISTGEVIEVELAASTGGRPSRRFVYNKDYAHCAVLYARIEGNVKRIYSTVVNMLGEKIFEETLEFNNISIDEIDLQIQKMIDNYPGIEVISLGLPGVVSNGFVTLCDFANLEKFQIQEHLKKRFNKLLSIDNDVNLTASGYYIGCKHKISESLIYIYYPEDGIAGAGIVVNGKTLRGATNLAGEISYMPLQLDRNEQGRAQTNSTVFKDLIVDSILTLNCTINPDCIVIAGGLITKKLQKLIQDSVAEIAPEGHAPLIEFENDIHDSYVNGLKSAGLSKLSCNLEVVEK